MPETKNNEEVKSSSMPYLGFDESEYDSIIVEKPDITLVKSQAAILKYKEIKELPKNF